MFPWRGVQRNAAPRFDRRLPPGVAGATGVADRRCRLGPARAHRAGAAAGLRTGADSLTLACAAYLAWLGVQGLRDAWSPPLAAEDAGEQGRNAFGAGAAISCPIRRTWSTGVLSAAPWRGSSTARRTRRSRWCSSPVSCLVADLVLLLRGAGGLAAAQHLAVLAPRQLRRLRRAPARPGGTGAARAVDAPQAGARRRRSRRWRRLSNVPRSTCRAWSPTTIRPSGSSAQCCSPPSRSSSP